MGLRRTISFPTDSRPAWESVCAAFRTDSESPAVRMIDDLPAFPDEIPEPGWKELRISLSGGMVTIRTASAGWECSIWGNADAPLIRSWNLTCFVLASVGQGTVELENGPSVSASEFHHRVL